MAFLWSHSLLFSIISRLCIPFKNAFIVLLLVSVCMWGVGRDWSFISKKGPSWACYCGEKERKYPQYVWDLGLGVQDLHWWERYWRMRRSWACAQCTAGEPSGVTKGDPETKLLSCPYLTGIITISNDVRCSQKRELQNAVMKWNLKEHNDAFNCYRKLELFSCHRRYLC